MTVRSSSTQSKMGLPLAEIGIFPSFTAPEVGVTPTFARFALDSLKPPFPVFFGSALHWKINSFKRLIDYNYVWCLHKRAQACHNTGTVSFITGPIECTRLFLLMKTQLALFNVSAGCCLSLSFVYLWSTTSYVISISPMHAGMYCIYVGRTILWCVTTWAISVSVIIQPSTRVMYC